MESQPVLLGEEGVLLVLLPDLPEVAPDGEDVPLGGEEELLAALVDGVIDVEEEVEVLAGLAEEEGLLSVLEALVGNVVHGGVAAVRLGVAVEALEDVLAHVEVEGVLGRLQGGNSRELKNIGPKVINHPSKRQIERIAYSSTNPDLQLLYELSAKIQLPPWYSRYVLSTSSGRSG